jgi:tellurite resistance protein TehA-like permease
MPPKHPPRVKDPLLLWWMPIVPIVAPVVSAVWFGATADSDALVEAAKAFVWPGLAAYAVLFAVIWGGWKLDLE